MHDATENSWLHLFFLSHSNAYSHTVACLSLPVLIVSSGFPLNPRSLSAINEQAGLTTMT